MTLTLESLKATYKREIERISANYIAHEIDYTEAMDQRRKAQRWYEAQSKKIAQKDTSK